MRSNRIPEMLLLAPLLLIAGTAHSNNLIGDLTRAVDAIKKGATMLPLTGDGEQQPGSAPSTAPPPSTNRNNLILPLDLTSYPRARQYKRVDNPMEQVRIPVSVPISTPDGFVAPHSVPMVGRVTMLQFAHRRDDSPILIRQHYEAWMAQQGFERLLVCEAPCHRLRNQYAWQQEVDPTKRLDSNYLPEEPTYIAGYKNDAMVLVGIGKHIFDFSSVVKVVEGRVLDADPWEKVTARRAPPPPVALVQAVTAVGGTPTQVTPGGAVPTNTTGESTAAAHATGVEIVTPDDLADVLARTKGIVVVQFSSMDNGCSYCVQSNPRFDTVAKVKADQGRFLRVTWQPYMAAFDHPLAIQYGLSGLPTFITFKDGKVVRRVNGNLAATELNSKLLTGVK